MASPTEHTNKPSLKALVNKQVMKVLERGSRFESFDQVRQRHFWSTYMFNYGAGNTINPGQYEIFKITSSMSGQGYPPGITLTERETNWKGNGRIPDNQNFVVSEMGVSLLHPPRVDSDGALGQPLNAPTDGIYAALTAGQKALVNSHRGINPTDAASILYGMVLEMGYLTNYVPMGLCADFSQSSGTYAQEGAVLASFNSVTSEFLSPLGAAGDNLQFSDPSNGVPCAAFRRKLEVPILLQHGEAMSMRLNVQRAIDTLTLAQGGAGWVEVRVDWWATESFVEKS
jgi:hypothetical protein